MANGPLSCGSQVQRIFCRQKHSHRSTDFKINPGGRKLDRKPKENDQKPPKHTETQGLCPGLRGFCISAPTPGPGGGPSPKLEQKHAVFHLFTPPRPLIGLLKGPGGTSLLPGTRVYRGPGYPRRRTLAYALSAARQLSQWNPMATRQN